MACRNALHPLLLSLTSHSAACSSRLARSAQALLYKAGALYASMLRSMLQALLGFVSHGTWGTLCTAAFLWMCCLYVAACCYSLSRQTADKIETVVRLCGEPGVHRDDTVGLAVRLQQSGWLGMAHTHSQFCAAHACAGRTGGQLVLRCCCSGAAPCALTGQSGLLPVRLAGRSSPTCKRCCLFSVVAAACIL